MFNKPGLGVRYVRVDRTCPRCHAHRYHSAHRIKKGNKNQVTINCAECGHTWDGRFKKDEWSDWVEEPSEEKS